MSGSVTIAQAQLAIDSFDSLVGMMVKSTKKAGLPILEERKRKLITALGYYASLKDGHDRQVYAGVAGAIVSLRIIPAKVSPIIRSITNSIKVRSFSPQLTREITDTVYDRNKKM